MSKDYTYEIKRLPESEIEVKVKAGSEVYAKHKEDTYQKLAAGVTLPGFRAGKAPRPQIEAKIANELFSGTIKTLLSNVAAEIIDTEGLNPLTQLDYDLTKASDTQIEFSFKFVNYPDIKLGDFSKLKFSPELVEVTEAEIDEVISNLFTAKDAKDKVKPAEVTPEMVAKLNLTGVSTVAELRESIETRIKQMKQSQADNVAIQKLLKEAVSKSKIPVPQSVLAETTKRQVDSYVNRIKELKMDVEEFLKAQGKTLEQLTKEKEEEAKTQIEEELLMNEIAKHYNVMPKAEDIDAEIAAITDPQIQAQYTTESGRRYIASVLVQQRALGKLKELAAPDNPKSKGK